MTAWSVFVACRGAGDGRPDDPVATHTGTAPTFLWDDGEVLVVPDGDGLTLFDRDGDRVVSRDWADLVGSCERCGGEGASADGDGLLVSFTTENPVSGGAVARLTGDLSLDWRVDGFAFPHDAVRDPADDTVLIPEIGGSRITWIEGDGASNAPLRRLDTATDGWQAAGPNGAERLDHDGRTYVLFSHRGGWGGTGFIDLWDITTPGSPVRRWRFPESGALRIPHGPVFRVFGGHTWLVYAHSKATDASSTVGLAWADDPTRPPTYVADLLPVGDEAPLDFLRGVELTSDGQLWLTDSGPGGGGSTRPEGRVLRGRIPADLEPSGRSGAWDDLSFVEFTPEPFATDLVNPFEGWLWTGPLP